MKFSWSQKLQYQDGQFCLNVPFTFPSYVNPILKSIIKEEKILVNVSSGTGTEVFFQSTAHHPLKVFIFFNLFQNNGQNLKILSLNISTACICCTIENKT